jgi:hypothetical protein
VAREEASKDAEDVHLVTKGPVSRDNEVVKRYLKYVKSEEVHTELVSTLQTDSAETQRGLP